MVYYASRNDRNRVVRIIQESFTDNPSVVSVINPNKTNSLKALAEYAFDTALMRQGVLLSDNQECVAICYHYGWKKEGIPDLWNQVKLVLNCIGLWKVPQVMRREAYLKKHRPVDGKFLYFWFFGSTKKGKDTRSAFSLKQAIFEKSAKDNLPIYLETSVPKNKKVYERFGFETYHEWHQSEDSTLYFMRRVPK